MPDPVLAANYCYRRSLLFTASAGGFSFCSTFFIFLWLSWVMWKDFRRPVSTGIGGMLGDRAQVVGTTKRGAKVLLRGELWDAVSGDELSVGETVRVTGFESMKLVIRKEKEE